jgi:hypothetical protein
MTYRYREENREFFVNNKKKNLVITIGDSWTFGDSLGSASTNKDDIHARQSQCYGKHLSDELDADWINCGYCGYGNIRSIRKLYEFVTGEVNQVINYMTYHYVRRGRNGWPVFSPDINNYSEEIQDEFSHFLKTINQNYAFPAQSKYTSLVDSYDNVYYVITLTEVGRETLFFDFIDEHKVYDYLIQEEKLTYDYIQRLVSGHDINLTVGRNFTTDLPETTNSMCLDKNWVQINHDTNRNNTTNYENITRSGIVSGIGFLNIKDALSIYKTHTFNDVKEYITNQITDVDELWHWLRNNNLNHNTSTCHPTKESHKLWAEYLLPNITL